MHLRERYLLSLQYEQYDLYDISKISMIFLCYLKNLSVAVKNSSEKKRFLESAWINGWKPQIWIRNGFRLAILGAVGAGDPFRRSLAKKDGDFGDHISIGIDSTMWSWVGVKVYL